MKKRMKRLAAMLLLGCMVAGSVPGGLVYAEESAPVSDLAENTGTGDVQEAEDEQIPENDVEEAEDEQASENDVEEAEDDQTSGNNVQEAEDNQTSGNDVQEAENDQISESDVQETDDAEKLQESDGKETDDQNEEAIKEQTSENSIIKKNADAINYVIVESPYLETPGTERIAVSYGDGSENISDATLTVRDDEGQETIWDLSVSADQLYLFTYEYTDESETGTYEVISLNVTDDTGEKVVLLSDSGMEANFGVNEEYNGIEELQPLDVETAKSRTADEAADVEATVAEIDPDNVEESTEQIVNALENAEEQTGEAADSSAGISAFAATMGAKAKAAAAKSDDGNIVVALDPGHDSTHAGASSNGLREEVLTLKIANYCKEELEKYAGVTVYMTRTGAACPHPGGSSGSDIGDRVYAAADAGADIYVSLHLNSSTASSVNGSEVIIPNKSWKPQVAEEGEKLAEAILKELKAIGLNMRPDEIYSKDTTINERYPDGSISDYFSVQIYAKERGIPGIIVEHAFITNSGDRNYLKSESGLKKLGVADATGIAKYLGISKARNQWVTVDGKKKYADANGKYLIGYHKIDGKYYYFDKDGFMQLRHQMINGKPYQFRTDTGEGYAKGWINYTNGKKGYSQGGGELTVGYKEIDGKYYYFDKDGFMQLRHQIINGKPYQFRTDTGEGYAKGWINYTNGKKGYSQGGGELTVGYKEIDGKYYYFDKDGFMQLRHQIINGKPYQFRTDTGEGYAKGWINYTNGKKGYSQGGGELTVGTANIGKVTYHFDKDGYLLPDHLIEGVSSIKATDLERLYLEESPVAYPAFYKNTDAPDLKRFCEMYIEEARAENIRVEVAFSQAMLETGWLKYGADVKIGQFNFAGLGATGGGNPGLSFESVRIGIRAQIQHLKSYANDEDLINQCVDPRFEYVQRGSCPYVEYLGGKWASDMEYGFNILEIAAGID